MKRLKWRCRENAAGADDHRESAFLFQRLSMLIQRYNAVAVLGTFAHITPEDEMYPFQHCSSF